MRFIAISAQAKAMPMRDLDPRGDAAHADADADRKNVERRLSATNAI